MKGHTRTSKLVALTVAPLLVLGSAPSIQAADPATPIEHVVVIFQENVSFDHYFGTYPNALNPAGEPQFVADAATPSVNGLNDFLLNHNPNHKTDGSQANPKRLGRTVADVVTCDQDHNYKDEQKSYDHGVMDRFVEFVSGGSCADKSIVMNYYDGNVVTALWNYAQYFAMSDNSFSTTFGPSTPGAINLVSGQTHGAINDPTNVPNTGTVNNGTMIGDARPPFSLDDCTVSNQRASMQASNKNVGDLLNTKGITWGWFQGGFRATSYNGQTAICGASHQNVSGATVTDYIPHHEPFQYYASTANPHHLPPTSTAMIGRTDQANHQYDIQDFDTALAAGNLPAVSFLKAAAYQDGHAGYSDPLDEQTFLVNKINAIMNSKFWPTTAIVILYDDSDGWYDHVEGPVVMQSNDPINDFLTDNGLCGWQSPLPVGSVLPAVPSDRCGYGPRQPLLVVSPYSKTNFVDHSVTDQSSVLRFIEDNWGLGQIGGGSADAFAGSLLPMFDFTKKVKQNANGNGKGDSDGRLILDPSTGNPPTKK